MTIFETASRKKTRFESSVGLLSTEDLWDLPLTAKGTKPNLDLLARGVSAELRSLVEDSFVDERPDPRKSDLELKLDLLKAVIKHKLDARAAAEKAAQTEERKRRLLNALASKEEAALAGMSKEEIEAEIAKLGA